MVSFFTAGSLEKDIIFGAAKKFFDPSYFVTALCPFRSCIFGNTKMRHCFLQVQSLVGRLTDMGVTEILQRKTYDLDDFFSRQLSLTSDFAKNLGEFRTIVCQLVLDTCKVCTIFDRALVSRGIYKRVFYCTIE